MTRTRSPSRKVDRLTAELKTEKARFSAWAKEVARDKEGTAERLEEQSTRSDELTDRVAQLEHMLGKNVGAGSAGAPERLVGKQDALGNQTAKKNSNRLKLTNELIGVVATGASTALTVTADALGTTVASDVTGIVGSLLGVGAAAIALVRKHREGRDGDRPKA